MSEFLEPARRINITKDILDYYKTDELSGNLEKLTDEKLCLVMDLVNSDAVRHDDILFNIDVIINATSSDIVPKYLDNKISETTLAYDINYNGTKFLEWAESKNLSVCNGKRMLREVAKNSFYIWHGKVIE